MGGVTLADPSFEPESRLVNTKTHISPTEALNQLAIDASALSAQTPQSQHPVSNGSFSISDFLVSGLQSKAWEDWQVADELNPFASDPSDLQSADLSALPFQFTLEDMLSSTMWDTASMAAAGLPADQAYDEYVFDLAPSHFATPATVNIADLLVGPNSAAPSVSPLDLAMPIMPANYNNYQDLALANLYGFTEEDSAAFDSDLGSDLSDASSDDEEDDDEDSEDDEEDKAGQDVGTMPALTEQRTTDFVTDVDEELNAVVTMSRVTNQSPGLCTVTTSVASQQPAIADPNKRRMEEALVARINNDLGPEHMPGLFKILMGANGAADQEDDDDEMEVDLSCLDETTLVELYQYVETCCMRTLGSILAAAEEQERCRVAAANAERSFYEARTPELSPSHSSSSSSSPSPSHPSSFGTGVGSSNNKKRSATASTSCTNYYERNGVEEQTEARWMAAQHKSKRKRVVNNSAVCMGGGGTGKGQRIQASTEELHADEYEDSEIGEDDEIDIVGI
ncbi:hypothetical protein BGZ99_005495 [Dissophora globulifera]|uniref:NET domain-containing protein n=1 Tax=Dissophora globulifera TaxID=979702 RepID=A0A9P6UT90_9FUNG|nr:hypothetical protein BGZ99_005495 [Dissophora globulifera]